ncbi:MAG: CehA/McbA family metallohydrolase [Chloroflexi bacterium]|nr:CehA/McbA family metallohydrolase [Chloroflexota bacterium]
MHTHHSDGSGEVEDLIAAAARTGLDFMILTDHNVLLSQQWQGWREGVLTLIDSEIHDKDLKPECNHCLALGIRKDVTAFAPDPQSLIDAVREQGGFAILAHPIEKTSPLIPTSFPWTAWDIEGYTGVEIWNFMSEFRHHATSLPKAIVLAFTPKYFTTGPHQEMLDKWDELLLQQPTVATGGSDAHANVFNIGPLRRRFLQYDYCFQAVNTHILTSEPFTQDFDHDRVLVYEALRLGRAWVAYDMLHPTDGFRFEARAGDATYTMGDHIPARQSITFEIDLPAKADLRLIRAGHGAVAHVQGDSLRFEVTDPGIYRVEAWKRYWLKPRGWIFSNAIYVT